MRNAAKKADAFALIGDRYHNSDYVRIALTRTIAKQMGVSMARMDIGPKNARSSLREKKKCR